MGMKREKLAGKVRIFQASSCANIQNEYGFA
jgi:hypothetical protein